MPASFDDVLAAFEQVHRYRQGVRRAPHKPLVLLYALRQLQERIETVRYKDAEAAIAPILREFWAPHGRSLVSDPFVRLEGDGFWKLGFARDEATTPTGSVSVAWLRRQNPSAGFDRRTADILLADPRRIVWAAKVLLFNAVPDDRPGAILGSMNFRMAD